MVDSLINWLGNPHVFKGRGSFTLIKCWCVKLNCYRPGNSGLLSVSRCRRPPDAMRNCVFSAVPFLSFGPELGQRFECEHAGKQPHWRCLARITVTCHTLSTKDHRAVRVPPFLCSKGVACWSIAAGPDRAPQLCLDALDGVRGFCAIFVAVGRLLAIW